MGHGTGRGRRGAPALGLVALALAGCAGGMPGSRPPLDPSVAAEIRQELERLRTDLADLRTLMETNRRAGVEHMDRSVREVRGEVEAVQQVLEANTRHTVQTQVETLDAQRKRLDVLDRRAGEVAVTLRKVEDAVLGLSEQVARLESASQVARAAIPAAPPASSSPALPPATEAAAPRAEPPAPPAPPAAAATAAPALPVVVPGPPAAPVREPRPAAAAAVARPSDAVPARPVAASVASRGTPGAPPPARRLFDRAMQSWKKGEQGQAVLELEELVRAHPEDPLAGAAQFWIGEAYFAVRDYERAAVEYRRSLELAPRGKETPQALLRLGLAYRAQRREPEARATFDQLVRDFPKSEAAVEARRALRER